MKLLEFLKTISTTDINGFKIVRLVKADLVVFKLDR